MSEYFKFQSTRPRGARPVGVLHLLRHFEVSIHAPTWGATKRQKNRLKMTYVSIHAPTWGATPGRQSAIRELSSFNPRAHVGRDQQLVDLDAHRDVSIHAPTWGATKRVSWLLHIIEEFQSTRPRGARQHQIHLQWQK